MTYHVQLSSDGMLLLPEDMVKAIGIHPGDRVSIERSGRSLVVRRDDGRAEATTRLRAALADYSVDRFLTEREADSGE